MIKGDLYYKGSINLKRQNAPLNLSHSQSVRKIEGIPKAPIFFKLNDTKNLQENMQEKISLPPKIRPMQNKEELNFLKEVNKNTNEISQQNINKEYNIQKTQSFSDSPKNQNNQNAYKILGSLENILSSIDRKFDFIIHKINTIEQDVAQLKKQETSNYDSLIQQLMSRLNKIEPIVERSQLIKERESDDDLDEISIAKSSEIKNFSELLKSPIQKLNQKNKTSQSNILSSQQSMKQLLRKVRDKSLEDIKQEYTDIQQKKKQKPFIQFLK